ncbi:MAG: YheT family hydrolase [Formosimonas sp.]
MHDLTPYHAPWWAANAHVQTIVPALLPVALPAYQRERWDTPDDDFIDIDWVNRDLLTRPNQRLIVLFHGLEGSSHSRYARTLMNECATAQHTGAVVHWRSCSGEMNRQAVFYHSGFSSEIDWILRRLAASYPNTTRHVAGVSLGGNALLKWLGEQGTASASIVHSAAAICAPHCLKAGSVALASGFNQRVYMQNFLATLKRKALHKRQQHPSAPINAELVRTARNFNDIDNAITAPLHGYRDAHDYWQRASCKNFLKTIATPTLVLNTLNDPFVPANSLAQPHEVTPSVTLEYLPHGGHVGFLYGHTRADVRWLPRRVLGFFTQS